jgi:hypothetical protein
MRTSDRSFEYRLAGGPAAGDAFVAATRTRRGVGAGIAVPMTGIPAALTQKQAWDNGSHTRPLVLPGGWTD